MASRTINALDLIPSEPIDGDTVMRAAAMMQQNTGTDTAKEKWMMLASMVIEEGWSRERFERTLKHLLKTHQWQTWTIADWFKYAVELHPYSWYCQQVMEHGASVNAQIEQYDLGNGLFGYRYVDGIGLPFPRKTIRDSK